MVISGLSRTQPNNSTSGGNQSAFSPPAWGWSGGRDSGEVFGLNPPDQLRPVPQMILL